LIRETSAEGFILGEIMTSLTLKDHSPIRVLLVENNMPDVVLIKEAFKESKRTVQVTVAKDGQEAMDCLRGCGHFKSSLRPNIILLDLNISKKPGLEVLSEIKSDLNLRDVPVIVLSESNLDTDISRAYDSHANFYIIKPAEFDQLLMAMKYVEKIWFGGS
jgi:chemotaxis family two-component system response regulator Rcp1